MFHLCSRTLYIYSNFNQLNEKIHSETFFSGSRPERPDEDPYRGWCRSLFFPSCLLAKFTISNESQQQGLFEEEGLEDVKCHLLGGVLSSYWINSCALVFQRKSLPCSENQMLNVEDGIRDGMGFVISVVMGTRSTSCSGESNLCDWCIVGFRMRCLLLLGEGKRIKE